MTTTRFGTSLGDFRIDSLAVLGEKDRLHDYGISLCGSRSADERGIEFARAVGSYAAQADLSLVSGYAKGVDTAGHAACVEAGGHTIAVLAEGLSRFRLRPELRAVIEPWDDELESQITVVSEFEHRAPWTVWRAMQRNETICSLGRVLVAIDPGDRGGTLDAVKKAIKRQMPVIIVWSDPEQPHDHLARELNKPNVSLVTDEAHLLATIDTALEPGEPQPAVSQPKLL